MLEICCGSYYDAVQAACGGAKRIELNSGLHLGGLQGAGQAVSLAMLLYFGFYFWRLATWPVAETPR